MFYPWHDESELKIGNPPFYCTKLKQLGLIVIIRQNKAMIESFSELVDVLFAECRMDLVPD